MKALSDPDANVRQSAAWALFNIQDPGTLPALEAAFAKETDPAIQADLIRAIGATGESSVDALSRLVSSPDARIRNAAVTALAGGGAGGPWPMPKPQPRPIPLSGCRAARAPRDGTLSRDALFQEVKC